MLFIADKEKFWFNLRANFTYKLYYAGMYMMSQVLLLAVKNYNISLLQRKLYLFYDGLTTNMAALSHKWKAINYVMWMTTNLDAMSLQPKAIKISLYPNKYCYNYPFLIIKVYWVLRITSYVQSWWFHTYNSMTLLEDHYALLRSI